MALKRSGGIAAFVASLSAFASHGRSAIISFDSGHTFSDTSTLISPTGGYAVHMGAGAATGGYTTATNKDGTPVAFESGPVNTGSSGADGLPSSTSASGHVTLTNIAGASGTASKNNLQSSTSFYNGSTVPTMASNPDTAFANALATGIYCGVATGNTALGAMQVTLNGLNIGQAYTVQMYFVDARTSFSGSQVALSNNADLSGATKFQYAFGATGNTTIGGYDLATFTADAASQSFYVNTYKADGTTSANGQINAIVVAATPEPTSLGLASIVGLLMTRRRREH